jgi:diguanylate cyclase (GGDEF)-like protein
VNPEASHDDFETRYWLRTAAAGSWVTILMSTAGLIYTVLFAAAGNRLAMAAVLVLIVIYGLMALFVVPWRRIVASPWRERVFLYWSALTVLMILLLTIVDGGSDSPMGLALFLPVVFASLAFPIRYVVTIGVLAEIAFVGLAFDGGLAGGWVLVFSSVLAGTGTMAVWQAKNHDGWRRELIRSSTTDPLTKLLNRRGFDMASERAFSALVRHGRPVTLSVIDLDYLKAYNDQHGHQAGDELLCWVGRRLASSVRVGDAVARLGGDEFAVLLPDTTPEAAHPVVGRLSMALSDRAPHCLGTATAPQEGMSFDDLYRCADAALYQRKLLRPRKDARVPKVVPNPSRA